VVLKRRVEKPGTASRADRQKEGRVPAGWGASAKSPPDEVLETVGARPGPGVRPASTLFDAQKYGNVDADREPVGEAILSAEILML